MDWKKQALTLWREGNSWAEITSKLKHLFPEKADAQVRDTVRSYIRRQPEYKNKQETKSAVEYNQDGTSTFENIIKLQQGEEITPEIMLKAHNLSPEKWEVISYRNNFWQQTSDTVLYQSRLNVKPSAIQFSLDDIDNYFKSRDFSSLLPEINTTRHTPEGLTAEILLPDLHVGLHAYEAETNNNCNLNQIKKDFFRCIGEIKNNLSNIKKIYLVTLGDILHVDNLSQSTTKGTFQGIHGSVTEMVETAEDMFIGAILSLAEVAPVELIFLSGNHDRLSGYMLSRSIYRAFENNPIVTVDCEPNPHKHRLIGDNLIGFCHGDLPRKNIANKTLQALRKINKSVNRVEVHSGHYHAEHTYETIGGVVVKHIPAICGQSYWEHQQGYLRYKTMVCKLWSDEQGLKQVLYSNLS